MSENGPDKPSSNSPPEGLQSNRARQLFGHKGGAKPWDAQASDGGLVGSDPALDPSNLGHSDTSSAPYPEDATYAPRPEIEQERKPAPAFLTDVDDDGELTRLHPNYKLLMQVGAIILGLVLFCAAAVLEGALRSEFGIPLGVIMAPAGILALLVALRWPLARYNARGYQISRDRLRVVRGVLWHSDTIVPFGRVQHIDVDQGPIERALDIATLTLHTAGTHNSSVQLPGLGYELAVAMREEIREHIKRESL